MSDAIVKKDFAVTDMQIMAHAIAKSNLFGIKTQEQALALCLIAQAEGRHPALAALDYHIINNKPSKSAKAIQRDFISAGGKIEWHESNDEVCDATFSHPQGGTLRVVWDMDKARQADLLGKGNWNKYPAAMLRARCVSEGCDAVCPGMAGLYPPEIVSDFSDEIKNVTPKKAEVLNEQTGEVIEVPAPTSATKEPLPVTSPDLERSLQHQEIKDRLKEVLSALHASNGMWTETEYFKDLIGKDNAKLEHIDLAKTDRQMDKLEECLKTAEKWLKEGIPSVSIEEPPYNG